MSRNVSANPQDWSEEDVLYLHQFDQRMDEVRARAEDLGVRLPEPTGVGAALRPVAPEPGQPCPTCGQIMPGLEEELEDDDSDYGHMGKEELRAEINARGLDDPGSRATLSQLRQVLVDDDEA